MKLVQDAVHLLLNIHNTDPFVSDSCGFLLYSAGAIVTNLALNVNLSYCMDSWTLGSKLQKNYCWTFFQ